MVSLMSLWLPILLSGVIVFIASSLIHMLLGYHNTDFSKLPSEDAVMDALRPLNVPPGEYVFPYASDSNTRRSPEYIEKIKKGPVGFITVMKNGMPEMGGPLLQWFVYSLVVGIFAGYVAGIALPPGAHYLSVFRFAGTTAFVGYALALAQNSIWYKRSWGATLKSMFDGLIYGLLTAGTFGWLWPTI